MAEEMVNGMTVEVPETQTTESPTDKAKEKYEAELKVLESKEEKFIFERPETREHFWKRFEEDPGLASDFLVETKSFKKCFSYMLDKARDAAEKGARGLLTEQTTIFEWVEDYIRKDDKAEEEEKKRKEEERKKKMEEDRKKREEQAKKKKAKEAKKETADSKDEKKEEPKEAPKPVPIAKSKKDIEGQMDLFSMFAQEGA